jgi:ABC-2 type transport system permease protein
MSLSAFKENLVFKLKVLKINTINSLMKDTAYFTNNLGNLFSTLLYTITFLVFAKVIFSNVDTLAGYSYDQMLFFMLVGQISFYSHVLWSFDNIIQMISDVNRGQMDLILIKPLPHLFYITFKRIYLVEFIRDGFISLTIITILINWNNIGISWGSLFSGIVVFIAGQIAWHTFQFSLGLIVFWVGQGQAFFSLSWAFYQIGLPYEGITTLFRIIFITLIPILLSSSLASSVILGKFEAMNGVFLSIAVILSSLMIKNYLWNLALKNYSSASS